MPRNQFAKSDISIKTREGKKKKMKKKKKTPWISGFDRAVIGSYVYVIFSGYDGASFSELHTHQRIITLISERIQPPSSLVCC